MTLSLQLHVAVSEISARETASVRWNEARVPVPAALLLKTPLIAREPGNNKQIRMVENVNKDFLRG